MSERLKLKPLHADSVDKAIDKAVHYRLLNEPEEAESICRDVLLVDPENQKALVNLILALTDQFEGRGGYERIKEARRHLEELRDDYQTIYFSAIVREHEARAFLKQGEGSKTSAYQMFRDAMALYDKAEDVRPAGNDDPTLRWNSCARTIAREHLTPDDDEPSLMIE